MLFFPMKTKVFEAIETAITLALIAAFFYLALLVCSALEPVQTLVP